MPEKEKILFVTDNFPPRLGGVANVSHLFCQSFPRGELSLIAPAAGKGGATGAGSKEAIREFDETQDYPIHRIFMESFGGNDLLTLLSLCNLSFHLLLRHWRDQYTHVCFGKSWPVGVSGLLLRLLRIPYAVYCHGTIELQHFSWIKETLRTKVLLNADCLIANCEYTKNFLIQNGASPERVVIILPKVDLPRYDVHVDVEAFKEKGGLAGKRVILTVGRLVPRKGHEQIIRALPQVLTKHPDAVYVIVSEGPCREKLENCARERGVAEQVIFMGRQDPLPYYHACDVFAMPSRDLEKEGDIEGFGIVFLEANACKKPVIAGKSGGMPEAVLHEETGLLVDPEDVAELANAINRLLGDAELAKRLGTAGYERVKGQFAPSRYAEEFRARALPLLRRAKN